jgi:glutamate dehydrogenase
LPEGGHASKSLINVLQTYPRDELFQIQEDELLRTAMAILQLGARQRFRLFVRRDPFERFLSCLIYAPRETYTTELRQKWQQILTAAFNGTSSEFNVNLSESMLARVLITVRTTPGRSPMSTCRELEARLAAAARRWDDDLREALIASEGEARGIELFRPLRWRVSRGLSRGLRCAHRSDRYPIDDPARRRRPLALSLHRPPEAAPGTLRFKLFRSGAPVTLSDSLPMLERMGFKVLDERPHKVCPKGSAPIWMHDFGIASAAIGGDVEIDTLHSVFEEAFGEIFSGEVENDDFNRLVAAARLPAKEIVVLRAYAKYLRQIGFALSQPFIESTLATHANIARLLVELFKLRFDPAQGTAAAAHSAEKVRAIEDALTSVDNLSEDRVLRQYLALINATTRTNYWRRDDQGRARSFCHSSSIRQRFRAAGAEADVRDLRVLDAIRRRAFARRKGRARRPTLVGSAGRFPYRSPRPRQGADGQEHRDRSRRLQGRLCA